jgi:hypothetical protein
VAYAGGRATHGAVAERVEERRIKSTGYIPHHLIPFDIAQDRLLPQELFYAHILDIRRISPLGRESNCV